LVRLLDFQRPLDLDSVEAKCPAARQKVAETLALMQQRRNSTGVGRTEHIRRPGGSRGDGNKGVTGDGRLLRPGA